MKKILFVIPTMRMGGAEKALVSLLKSLDPELVDVDLFLFEHGGVLQDQLPSWVHILPEDLVARAMTLEFRFYWKDLLRRWKLRAAIARLWMLVQPSIRKRFHIKPNSNWRISSKHIRPQLQEYDAAIGFLEGTADFYVIDKTNAKKKIGWIHNDFTNRKIPEFERALYDRFDELATISEICRQAFCALLPEISDKISVIENVTCKDDIRKAASLPMDDNWDSSVPQLLTVGRLEVQKGIDIAARTSKVLLDRGFKHQWHVLGMGSMEAQIVSFIHDNYLEGVFSLDGLKSNPYPYMYRADLIVQSSRWEGKSIVLDEAKTLGKAIITTNYPSVSDQIEDGKTGIITEMTPDAIADGIQEVLENPILKQQLERSSASSDNNSSQAIRAFYKMIGL